jgi:hypothetical protein
MNDLRHRLVTVALEWERAFGNAPSITTVISEYDAAMLLGIAEVDYQHAMGGATSVQRGYDFKHGGIRFQVKGTRPSGKPGSNITKVPGVTNYDWDQLIWVSYTSTYAIHEAWLWQVEAYRNAFHEVKRISPSQMRQGIRLAGKNEA